MRLVKFLSLILLATPAVVLGQVVNGRFNSSVYSWERFDTVGVSKTLLRGFQTLQLNVAHGDLSLQTYAVGSMDFASFGDHGTIRFFNAFVRWKNIGNVAEVNVGRVPVFAGVGNGAVDGALVKARVHDRVTLVAYGGANVRPDLFSMSSGNVNDNMLIGGQAITDMVKDLRIGLSYVKRNFKRDGYTATRPDSLGNPLFVPVSFDSRAEQTFGIDTRYAGIERVTAYGRYDYDFYSKRTLRAQISGWMEAMEDLALTVDVVYREPRIWRNSFFAIFPITAVREYEAGAEYTITPSYRASGKFAYVDYEGDAARRLLLMVYCDYGSLSYSGINGYAGQLSSFSVQGMYPLMDRVVIPTVGLSYATYRHLRTMKAADNVFAATLGAVLRPQPAYSVDFQLQWQQTPIASNDVRVFGKLNYWFHENLHLLD
jgi:hypothetical protein